MWTKKDNIATLLTWHRSWWTRSGREKTEIWPKVNWRSVKVLLYQQPLHQLITAETVSKCNHQHLKSRMVKELDEGDRGWADHHRVRGVHAVQDLMLMRIKILLVDHCFGSLGMSQNWLDHLCSSRLNHGIPNWRHRTLNFIGFLDFYFSLRAINCNCDW